MTAVGDFFTALLGILNDFLLPTTGITPITVVIWFFIVMPALFMMWGFIRGLMRRRS